MVTKIKRTNEKINQISIGSQTIVFDDKGFGLYEGSLDKVISKHFKVISEEETKEEVKEEAKTKK